MKTRIFTAFVGVAIIIGLVTFGGWLLSLAVCLVSFLAFNEYANMMKQLPLRTFQGPAWIALVVCMIGASYYTISAVAAAWLVSFFFLLLMVFWVQQSKITALMATVFGTMYIGMGFSSLLLLRGGQMLSSESIHMDPGLFLIWFAFLGTWASDIFAYFVGKKYGKHSLAPQISPHKTREGFLGGVIGSVAITFVFSVFTDFHWVNALLMGVVVAIAAPVGDLFESYIKRACNRKDSGTLLPGHGGVLDRFDSLLFVAPTMVVFLHTCI